MKKLIGILIFITLVGASQVFAFGRRLVGTSGAQFLKLGVNARAIAMGEAYAAVADGADAIYWNPAGLGRMEGKSFSFMHAVYLNNVFYDFASYAHKIEPVGTLAVGVQYLGAGSIDETNDVGTTVGTFKPSDMAVSIGWARKFQEFGGEGDFILGVTGKFIRSTIVETAVSGAADLGITWNALEKAWLSLGVQNLGPALKFKNEGDDLPVNIFLGSAFTILEPLVLAVDANFPRHNDPYGAIGTEYKYAFAPDMWVAGRVGYNTRTTSDIKGLSGLSAGAGFAWKSYGVDFAWVPFGNLGNSYRFSLSAKF